MLSAPVIDGGCESGIVVILDVGQGGAIVVAMIGFQHLQSQIGLMERWIEARHTIGKSHPVEVSDVILLGLLDEIVDKLEHLLSANIIVSFALSSIDITGTPFANNDGGAFIDNEMGVQVAYHLVDSGLGCGEIGDVRIGMHLEDEVVALACRLVHLLQRVEQMSKIRTSASMSAIACTTSIGVDDDIALGVVASCGTNHVDKALGVAVDGTIGL